MAGSSSDNASPSCSGKYRVLILGGMGFIGQHLVEFLIRNDLVSKVRVVDKVPPQIAWLNKSRQELFEHPLVEFKSANLINAASCQSAFTDPEGEYDFVVNLAAETKSGQSDPVYKEGIVKLSIHCAKEAAKRKVKKYVELSSGYMHSNEKKPAKETSKLDPWTFMARFKLMVEEELANIPDLNYVILRPAIVYGIGDKQGITPRLIVGAVYKYLGEMMKLLWTKDMKMNTIHVTDLCRAIWHVFTNGSNREIYNVVDKGDTTQGKMSSIISEIFNINHDYWGSAMSTLAKTDMKSLVEDINDKHMGPWAELCNKDGISNTPLNPYLYEEFLYDRNIYLDGSKLESTGFCYEVPNITLDRVKEILQDYAEMGLFPRSLLL
ncbi:uncharacterized protein LOC106457008 isoform X1 [Limulus polyphemus]|uniref:Uncharacterized protein LOC106457008 isoform X1 n=2 Tax=Limulus polyphemus TaxID=6850 RepID=A0ABM1AZR2_LIMPO|nr:uncharacterized protein LOC106457008 isoform X1 [Limulus polyphemus]